MPDGRGLKRALPKLENNVLQPPLAWSSNRRMKIDDWIRPYYENRRSPFVSGGMRWKLQEGRIVRVSVNESVKFQSDLKLSQDLYLLIVFCFRWEAKI